ncbi:DUF6531 domain-containing protein [Streptomyces sp. NPDC005963]|uniref:DUF6531 domain-containing protein n=1 Tax=Streptomyces sp. NPDC005963 TaxID=3156721 RepID=UPI0033C05692
MPTPGDTAEVTGATNHTTATAATAGTSATSVPSAVDAAVPPAVRVPLGDRTELVVDPASGELVLRHLDLVIAGTKEHLRLVREYRSRSPRDEGFGPGWSLSTGSAQVQDRASGPVTIIDDQGRTTTVDRTGDGRFTAVVDPTGVSVALLTYDPAGRLVRQVDATGAGVEFDWDTQGRLVRVTPAEDGPVRLRYDERDSVVSVEWTGTDGPTVVRLAYDGDRTTVTDPAGKNTVYVFDSAGRLRSETDPLGHTVERGWDEHGRLVRYTDATGAEHTYAYDALGRPISLRLPTTAVLTVAYDDPTHPGLPTALQDAAGNQLLLERDKSGRIERSHTPGRPLPLDTRAYDSEHGRITELTHGNGANTHFDYDTHGNLIRVRPPAPLGEVGYGRDELSRITRVTDGNGQTIGHRRDAADRLVEVVDEDTDTPLLSLAYDAVGRVVGKSGADWSYAFQWLRTAGGNRLTSAVRSDAAGSEEVSAVYNGAGSLTALTTPGGVVHYGYDDAGRPASVTTPGGATVVFGHDAAGRLTSVDHGSTVQHITHDASGRRTGLTLRTESGKVLLTTSYSYTSGSGADGDVLRHAVDDGTFTGYGYDGLKRLVRAGETEYAYDDAHHLVRLGGIHFDLNEAGQVTRFGETLFGYDGAGSFTDEQNPDGRFAYSPTRQTLTGVFGGQQVVDIAYDGLGQETPRRITETTVDGHTVTHVLTHSPLGVVRVTDNGVPTDFVRAPDGTLLAVLTADGRRYWAVTDQQGSVLALVDETGAIAARYHYTPHGAVTASGAAAGANPFRYRGAYQLLRSAHVLDHHLYNGFWGRFTQPDPTGRRYATYTFSDNDPVNSGTWTRADFWSVLARPFEPAAQVFLPSPVRRPRTPGEHLTGPGAFAVEPPSVTGTQPSRTL